MIAISISSCSKKIAFLNSSVVPAARGDVQVHKDKNMNYVINVHISELAEVSRLSPPRQFYIIWMVTDQDITKNIGKLNSKMGGISQQLNASFETVSAFKPNKIFITAEDDASVQFPNSQIILSTDSF
ncbi:MAG: hypothetical protein ACOVMG_03895 [Flavobacterium sp.]